MGAAEVDVGPAGEVEDEFRVLWGVGAGEAAVVVAVVENAFEGLGVFEAGEDGGVVGVELEVEQGGGSVVEGGEEGEVAVGEVVEGVEQGVKAVAAGAGVGEGGQGGGAELFGGGERGFGEELFAGVAAPVEGDPVESGFLSDLLDGGVDAVAFDGSFDRGEEF